MVNTLLITKETGNYFSFVLNGNTANKVTSIKNDLLAVGEQLHFKTANGANIIKEQFIYPANLTVVSGGTFTFTTVAEVWTKLIEIGFFDWISAGGESGASRFDDLLDTFKYTGKDGMAIIVNESQQKLEAVTIYNYKKFTELQDTPSTLVPNKMVVVNAAGTALELKDQPVTPPQYLNSVGYFDYNDAVTQTTPLTLVANTALKLTNDTLGAFTNIDQPPYGVSTVWDAANNEFDFTQLSIGDTIDVRIHLVVNTTASNQKFHISAKFGIGSTSVFENIIFDTQVKTAGANEVSFVAPFYIGSNDIKNYPAELYITSDSSGTVKVNGFYIRILRKNINIVSVETGVNDASASVKGILRLAGDLGGTATNPTVPELANKVPKTRTITINGTALDLSADRSWTISTTANWGGIGGTLSNQTDLLSALNAKQNVLNGTGFVKSTAGVISYDNNVYATLTELNDGLDTKENIIGAGTTAQYWRGDKTWQTLDKTAVGLANVDNTSDINKPISTATQNALNLKANDNEVVKLTGNQTIAGVKTFDAVQSFNYHNYFKQVSVYSNATGFTTVAGFSTGLLISTTSAQTAIIQTNALTGLHTFTLPNASGTFALTSDLTNKISGTLTSGYIPKATGSTSLGNSSIYDNGTNIGIGTTSPGAKLHLIGSSETLRLGTTTSDNYFTFFNSSGAQIGDIGFDGRDTNILSIWNNSNGGMLFGTNSTERMRITSSGQVQISSPISDALKLTNTNSGAYNGVLIQNDASNQVVLGIGGSTVGGSNQNRGYSGTVSNIDYYLMTNNTERVRITSSGNVGIGTTAPNQLLSISSSSVGGSAFGLYNTASNTDNRNWALKLNAINYGDLGFFVSSSNGGNPESGSIPMLINKLGNVGIGTTAPSEKLEVSGLIKSTNGISVGGSGVSVVWTGTQAAYDAIGTKSSTTIYFIQ